LAFVVLFHTRIYLPASLGSTALYCAASWLLRTL
jgi:hypothetical protein